MRKSFLMSLGAAFGSSLGVAFGAAAGGALALALGAAAGMALGVGLAWLLVPSPSPGPSPSLALVVIARDEERGLPRAIASVKDYVNEIVVAVDSRTTDRTREVAPGAHVFDVTFLDYAQMRTAALRAAKSDWILMLDGDETLEGDPRPLMRRRVIWKMARRHWKDLERRAPAADDRGYPDRQRRLFPNDPRIRFERPVHELVEGFPVKSAAYPLIHHFKEALRPRELLAERQRLYAEMEGGARSPPSTA
ncbi:MAG: glycosyltransferase [Planctomycetota bacterium]